MLSIRFLSIGRFLVHLVLPCACLFLVMSDSASAYSFSLDRFEVSGNVPGSRVDDFDDGVVSPWVIWDPTVTESGGFMHFSTPGTAEAGAIKGVPYTTELTFIGSGGNSPWNPVNGFGDFTGVSRWAPIIPTVNEWYEMQIEYETPEANVDFSLAVANWDAAFAGIFDMPPGLGITFYRDNRRDRAESIWQHTLIEEADIEGDILLRLDFDDSDDEFTASFSLDGGVTYQNPFAPVTWGVETSGHYEWYFSGQSIRVGAIPAPGAIFLGALGTGLVGWLRRRRTL